VLCKQASHSAAIRAGTDVTIKMQIPLGHHLTRTKPRECRLSGRVIPERRGGCRPPSGSFTRPKQRQASRHIGGLL
jgi:hypothetical protein